MNEERTNSGVEDGPSGEPAPAAQPGVVGAAVERLRTLRGYARWLLVTQRGAWIIGLVVMALLGAGLVDYVLRTPAWMRTLALVFGAAILGGLVWRHLVPALRFRPDLEALALRVERTPAGREVGLAGLLASGVGLREQARAGDLGGRMAARVTIEAAQRARRLAPLSVLNVRPAMRAALVCLVLLTAALALVVVQPALSSIGARRLLLPWSAAAWPLRSQVVDATSTRFHALGAALPIRAGLVRSPDKPEAALVELHYRLFAGGRPLGGTGARSLALNLQGAPIRVSSVGLDGQPATVEAPLFAQDLPASVLAAPEGQAPPDELEYWLTSGDAQTSPTRIKLVQPPAVVSATAVVTPPAYWAAAGGVGSSHELGTGTDERAIVQGVLAGSEVALTLTLNKPIPVPALGTPERSVWESASVGVMATGAGAGAPGLGALVPSTVDAGGGERTDRLVVRFTPGESVRVPVRLSDEFGIQSADDAAFRVQTVEDRAPEATVTLPESDVEVLPTAKVELVIEGRDDLALASLAAQYQLARRPVGSAGAPPEAPREPPADLEARTFSVAGGRATTQASIAVTITPGDLAAQAGDEVWVTGLARDVYAKEGAAREAVRSSVRKVRVISSEQLVEQAWNELLSIRRAGVRTIEQQSGTRERTGKGADRLDESKPESRQEGALGEAASELERAEREQRTLQQTLARMSEAAQRLGERLKQNDLQEPDVQQALSDAARLVSQAQDAAQEAGQRLEQARAKAQEARDARGRGEAAASEAAARQGAERAGEARGAQEKVEQALDELARKLDRGQDAWAVRRALDRLAQEQKGLRERVQKSGESTAGKSRDALTPEQQQQADQAAAQQEQLAQRLNQLQQQMQEAAKNLQRSEPTTAQALKDAAQRAQRAQAAQQMQQAAEQIRQNQQESASRQQQKIEETLRQMQQDLQQAAKQQSAVLKRQLESLVESIRAMIARQEAALANVRRAVGAGPEAAGNLDTELITLNTSTLDAVENARAAGRETLAVVRHLSSAGDAQSDAIAHLRASPPALPSAQASEERSLAALRSALEEAQKALNKAENREQDQARDELRAQYAALLAEQRALIAATAPLVGKPVDRRSRLIAGDLKGRQSKIHTQAEALLASKPDLTNSPTFPLAHRRLEGASTQAAEMLGKPDLSQGLLIRQETVARTLEGLIQALASSSSEDDPFRSPEESGGEQGGQGGQQSPGLIPSAAEVALLKALQQEALNVTRQASEAQDAALSKLAADDAQRLQSELPRIADEIVKKIEQESGGGGGGGGGVPKSIVPPGGGKPGEEQPPAGGGGE